MTYGSSNVAIQILLPEQAPVKNNTYRDSIIDRGGNQQQIRVEDFADLVRANRPKWLRDYVEREARKNTSEGGVVKRLKALMAELKAPGERRFEMEPGGEEQGTVAQRTRKGTGESSDSPCPINEQPAQPRPAQGRRSSLGFPGIPHVTFSEDPAILEEMLGRAGMYNRADNVVLLNPKHFKYKEDLKKIFRDVDAATDRRFLAKQLFDEEYCYSAGKFVILAWLFKGKEHWDERDWEGALSMTSLSVHLAEPTCLENARKRLRQKLNSRRVEV